MISIWSADGTYPNQQRKRHEVPLGFHVQHTGVVRCLFGRYGWYTSFLRGTGAKLYTQMYGHGAPIIFLHGGTVFFDNSFTNQRDYFATYRTVIGIDQRAHGHSPDGAWPLSYKMMADDTATIIEQLGLGPVDIVGHSDGTDLALILARDHPQLVRRLVISGANLRADLTPEEKQRHQWSLARVANEAQ